MAALRYVECVLTMLRDLSFRCRQTWDNLLPHLRYSQDCWKSDMPLTVYYMHAKVHLAYLQIHFQIYHTIGEDSSSPLPELLEVSANILETVVQMGNSRSKGAFAFNDLPEIVSPLPHILPRFCIS